MYCAVKYDGVRGGVNILVGFVRVIRSAFLEDTDPISREPVLRINRPVNRQNSGGDRRSN